MELEYNDIICELDQTIADENEYNASVGIKKNSKSGIKDLKQKFVKW